MPFPYHIRDFNFVKATSLGDDFILFDQRVYDVPEDVLPIMARTICRRDFSIGADGMVLVCKPTDPKYDIRCRIFNADGSEADMRSSAIRIFSRYVYEQHIVTKLKILPDVFGNDSSLLSNSMDTLSIRGLCPFTGCFMLTVFRSRSTSSHSTAANSPGSQPVSFKP